jgi:peroxiredoxin
MKDEYEQEDIRIVALSADPEAGARKMRMDGDLSFPILYGLGVDEMKKRYGLYIEKGEKTHVQPAQFLLDPKGAVRLACYSSGAVGRLSAEEALNQAKAMKEE